MGNQRVVDKRRYLFGHRHNGVVSHGKEHPVGVGQQVSPTVRPRHHERFSQRLRMGLRPAQYLCRRKAFAPQPTPKVPGYSAGAYDGDGSH